MYDLFDTFFNPWYDDSEYNKKAPKQQASQNTQNLMKTDIRELADGYELQMELPGYKKEEVQAALHKGYLTISAAKSTEENMEGKYLRRERYTGSCQRSSKRSASCLPVSTDRSGTCSYLPLVSDPGSCR